MNLRRIIQHLKTQQWTAIGIELVIVILGVFIGTQVSNWNESRHEEARAREALARIQEDLQTDLRTIGLRSVFCQANQGVALNVIGNTRRLDTSILATIAAEKP